MNNYDFRLDSLTTIFEDKPLFIIHFWPLNNRVKGGRTGKIFLEPETKSIVRIEYELTKNGMKELVNSNTAGLKISGKNVNAYTQYRLLRNKWCMQDAQIIFQISIEEKLDKEYKIDANIQMRYVSFENLPLMQSAIYPNEILLSTNNFGSAKSLNPDFWQPFNYIKSTKEAETLQMH